MSRKPTYPTLQLPAAFVEKLLDDPMMSDVTSFVFGSTLRPIRQAIASHYTLGYGDNEVYVFPKPGSNPMSDPERASLLLHFAAGLADPLLACEVIRLGADVDQERDGVTALQVAISKMAWVYTEVPCKPSRDAESLNGNRTQDNSDMLYFTEKQNLLKRFQHIAISFIEQHADVNRSKDGLTPLHGACQAHNWELIALLLRHGADTSSLSTPTPESFFSSEIDRTKYKNLVDSVRVSSEIPRPARRCPCWSGLPLRQCHQTEKPYPPEFHCPCGSQKTYKKCCARRNFEFFEKWSPGAKWLQPFRRADHLTSEHLANCRLLERVHDAFPEELVETLQRVHFYELMIKNGAQFDPAFAYVLRRGSWTIPPFPSGRSVPKVMSAYIQRVWNADVDKYIALGVDGRSREVIERATKIGPTCGALFRVCEGVDCNKMEGVEVEKLHMCARCKLSVYCSKDCQSSAWKTHKRICGDPEQNEQALPSQAEMMRIMRMIDRSGSQR